MSTTYHGVQAKFAAKTDNTVAYTDVDDTLDVQITTGRDIFTRYAMGDAAIKELIAGKKLPVEISCKRHYESGNFSAIGKSLPVACQDGVLTYYGALFPEGDVSPKFLIGPGTFYDWGLSTGVDGMTEETFKFRGTLLAVS